VVDAILGLGDKPLGVSQGDSALFMAPHSPLNGAKPFDAHALRHWERRRTIAAMPDIAYYDCLGVAGTPACSPNELRAGRERAASLDQ
jgi:hypothetical protein